MPLARIKLPCPIRLAVASRPGKPALMMVSVAILAALAAHAQGSPSTRLLTFAKAVAREVDVSSAKGEKPQSSIVPNDSIGISSAASSTRSRTSSGLSTLGLIGSVTPTNRS